MQRLVLSVISGGVLAGLAGAALAAAQLTEATLAAPVSERRQVIVDGKLWTCEGTKCTSGNKGISQPVVRECARAARVLGPIVEYRRGEVALTDEQIKACND
jgi:hypothetical protein